jgi:nitrogen fixation/metabolism regulation signal transduction histidine kinase
MLSLKKISVKIKNRLAPIEESVLSHGWKRILWVLLIFTLFSGLLEYVFSNFSSSNSGVPSATVIEKTFSDVQWRLREIDTIISKARDLIVIDNENSSTLQNGNVRGILQRCYQLDSIISREIDATGLSDYYRSHLGFAIYDSTRKIVGWNAAATLFPSFDNQYKLLPQFENKLRLTYIDKTPSELHIASAEKIINASGTLLGYAVVKFRLDDVEQFYHFTTKFVRIDFLRKIEQRNNVSLSLTVFPEDTLLGVASETNRKVLYANEGEPSSRIGTLVVNSPITDSSLSVASFFSGVRDLSLFIFLSICLSIVLRYVIFKSISPRRRRVDSRSHIWKGILWILVVTFVYRLLLYYSGSLRDILPMSLTNVSIYAYKDFFLCYDPLEFILTVFTFFSAALSIFWLVTDRRSTLFLRKSPIGISKERIFEFVINVPATILIVIAVGFLTELVTRLLVNNSSIDLSRIDNPLRSGSDFILLCCIFLCGFSSSLIGIGLSIFLLRIRQAHGESRTMSVILTVILCTVSLLFTVLLSNTYYHTVPAHTALLQTAVIFLFTIASIPKFNFFPDGFGIERSIIALLLLCSLVCFYAAPSLLEINSVKNKQVIEQSVTGKANEQFDLTSIIFKESVASSASRLRASIGEQESPISALLYQEWARLSQEIPGAKIVLSIRNRSGETIAEFKGGQDITFVTAVSKITAELIPRTVARKDAGRIIISQDSLARHSSFDFLAIGTPLQLAIKRTDTATSNNYYFYAIAIDDIVGLQNEMQKNQAESKGSVVPFGEIKERKKDFFIAFYKDNKLQLTTESHLNLPGQLPPYFIDNSEKGAWNTLEIDGSDYSVYTKSFISDNGPDLTKVLAAGMKELDYADEFLFSLRFNILGLFVPGLVIIVFLLLKNRFYLKHFTLRFRDRIFLIILVIALLPLIFASNISRSILQERELDKQRTELVAEANNFSTIIHNTFTDSVDFSKLASLTSSVSQTLSHRIDIYNERGILVSSSFPQLFEAHLLPSQLSLQIAKAVMLDGKPSSIMEYRLGSQHELTAFKTIYDNKHDYLQGILSISKIDQSGALDTELAQTTSLIYGIFSLVSLFLLILGSYISYRVASPLQEVISATDKVARGALGTRLPINRQDEIGDLANAFNRMTHELEKSREREAQSEREGAWKEMARQVAHEIKNPLTPMKLSVQHVQHAYETKDTNFTMTFNRVMRTLSEQIDVLTRIATEFSRFGEMPRRRYGFLSLRKVSESAVALFDSERSRIRFVIDIPEKMSSIYADEEEFRRALVNIIRNAIQATENWGIILISAYEEKGLIHLKIKDTGGGMSEETVKKAFDPNFSTKTSGMGLGLAIVKRTITDMSGTITVESELRKGTTFHIELPAREA